MNYNLSSMLSKYIRSQKDWTPVDKALYKFKDILNVDQEIGNKLRFNK